MNKERAAVIREHGLDEVTWTSLVDGKTRSTEEHDYGLERCAATMPQLNEHGEVVEHHRRWAQRLWQEERARRDKRVPPWMIGDAPVQLFFRTFAKPDGRRMRLRAQVVYTTKARAPTVLGEKFLRPARRGAFNLTADEAWGWNR